LDLLLDTYSEIGEILPGLTRFRNALVKNERLKVHLENYYCDVLDFHRNALDVFSRPGKDRPRFHPCQYNSDCVKAWKTLFHPSWRTFQTKFGPILSGLKRHRQLISDEKLSVVISEVGEFRESIEGKLEALSVQMKRLQLHEKEQETLELQEQRRHRLEFILSKFNVADYQSDLKRSRDERLYQSSSGAWIFGHRTFKEWADLKSPRHSVLFMSGIPGAGLSYIASFVVLY